jgi:hypothetical protein
VGSVGCKQNPGRFPHPIHISSTGNDRHAAARDGVSFQYHSTSIIRPAEADRCHLIGAPPDSCLNEWRGSVLV